jgi:DNA-binding MarR family transcriptional regulator
MSSATAVKIPAGSSGALNVRDKAEPGLRAWRGLLRSHACLVKRLDAELERCHGLPMSSFEVLHHLASADDGRMRMRELAERAQLSRSGLTRLVDRLERDGYLERCSCAHDARGAFAVLTPAGREKLAAARETHLAGVRELFLRHFSEEDLELLGDRWEHVLADLTQTH